jgi:transcriptional regulator with XRE-family HTH domain
VPGWESVNVTLLAHDLSISFRYLLAVLTGQRNCTLSLLQQVARALGITLTELINRMEAAYYARAQAQASKVSPEERRRVRNEHRALASR